MARAVRSETGTKTSQKRLSDWIRKNPRPEMLTAISLLHPDPRACLRYLRSGGTLPPAPKGFRPWLHQRPVEPIPTTTASGGTWQIVQEALARAYDKMVRRNELEGRSDGIACAVELLYTMATALGRMGEDVSDLEEAARRLLRRPRGEPPP